MEPREGGPAARDTASERDASAKRAQGAPPQLLELWTRADLADAVVDFLPAKAIACLSVVAKPLRDAQARVVHAAARRRDRSEAVTRATFQALEAGEVSHFRESWNDGRARWNFRDVLGRPFPNLGVWGFEQGHGYDFGIVELENTPPRLLIARHGEIVTFRRGLTCQFSEVGRRLVRFRVEVSVDASTMDPNFFEVGCAAITGARAEQMWSGHGDFGTGICFVKEYGPTGVCLKWFNDSVHETLVQGVTDEVYTVDASFIYCAYPMVARVSVNGGNPVYLPCHIPPVNFVHLYSQDSNIIARYGNIDVWHEPATPYGTGIYESPYEAPRRPRSPTSPDYTPLGSPAHEPPPTPTSPPPTGWDSD